MVIGTNKGKLTLRKAGRVWQGLQSGRSHARRSSQQATCSCRKLPGAQASTQLPQQATYWLPACQEQHQQVSESCWLAQAAACATCPMLSL